MPSQYALDLLQVARTLCPANVGPGRPPHARLRRAISTAYYALFWELTERAARPYSIGVRPAASRLIDHGSARDVCHDLTRQGVVPWLAGQPSCHQDLRTFALDFDELQQARHIADYDHAYAVTRRDALTAIRRAERSLQALDNAQTNCPDQIEAMCVAMFAPPKLRKRLRR